MQAAQGHIVQPVAAKYARQLPALHTSSFAQRLPQPPQLSGSVCSFTHELLLQSRMGAVHARAFWQLPITQAVPIMQRVPSAPQLLGSLCKFTHVAPMVPIVIVSPARHTHIPLTHICVSPQRRPIIPQLLGSLATTTQPPPGVGTEPEGH